jgi:hypothetical protein
MLWHPQSQKDELDLIVPHRFSTYQQPRFGDGHVYASVSRFIPSSIRNFFDCQHWGERTRGPAEAAIRSGATTDFPASLLRYVAVGGAPRLERTLIRKSAFPYQCVISIKMSSLSSRVLNKHSNAAAPGGLSILLPA